MAWVYLQGSGALNLDSKDREHQDPSVLLRRTNTVRMCSPKDFLKCRSGMMSKPLMENIGREKLISLAEDFLVRISQDQEKEKESKREHDLVFGFSIKELLGKYNHSSHLLKTSEISLFEDSTSCLQTLPQSGTVQNGSYYPLQTWEHPIYEKDALSWPTPRSCEAEGGIVKNVEYKDGTWSRKNKQGVRFGIKLKDAVAYAQRNFPTPTKSMMTGADMEQARFEGGNPSRPSYQEAKAKSDGLLNPEWEEWLMGFPLGWTDLSVSATQLCHSAQNTLED